MEYFVNKNSVVREIWGKGDTVLLIFAGASAEFALNKEVDWLYFTGRLPADPMGRLFSTVGYARKIVFSSKQTAHQAIDSMTAIHSAVEFKRGIKISDEAYRDVLFLLIDYSIRSFEVLERKLSISEKQEIFNIFSKVGDRMGINGLPETFEEWENMRLKHMQLNLRYSLYTKDLLKQYRKHLGFLRYRILLEGYALICPRNVRELLGIGKSIFLKPLILLYKLFRRIKIDWLLKAVILPAKYKNQFNELDRIPY